ncbi:hypothetical protein Bbelb_363540 [Branchiostoma belcheri]|nr:hypothetical protein Bbelb_363540 [Branchiostoma belcheri]
MQREEKKANYTATRVPNVKTKERVLADAPMPDAATLPTSLPTPKREQVQYEQRHHETGSRRAEKRRLDTKETERVNCPIQPKPAVTTFLPPRVSAAPVLLVLPAQPQAPTMVLQGASCVPQAPPPPLQAKPVKPHKSFKPCAACNLPRCGGQRKRYTPSKNKTAGSSQKMFTCCPVTRKSVTAGFEGVVYTDYEHFKLW